MNSSQPLIPILTKVILPPLLTVALFMFAAFQVFLPSLEASYLERKRESLRNLVTTVISELAADHVDVSKGLLTKGTAQTEAIRRLQSLRYGEENKDYFWVLTADGSLLMHPYRNDLLGKTLKEYQDPNVRQAIATMVAAVKDESQGFINYQWQWQDDPKRREEQQKRDNK